MIKPEAAVDLSSAILVALMSALSKTKKLDICRVHHTRNSLLAFGGIRSCWWHAGWLSMVHGKRLVRALRVEAAECTKKSSQVRTGSSCNRTVIGCVHRVVWASGCFFRQQVLPAMQRHCVRASAQRLDVAGGGWALLHSCIPALPNIATASMPSARTNCSMRLWRTAVYHMQSGTTQRLT
jgi:hypothetical protein